MWNASSILKDKNILLKLSVYVEVEAEYVEAEPQGIINLDKLINKYFQHKPHLPIELKMIIMIQHMMMKIHLRFVTPRQIQLFDVFALFCKVN